MGLGINARLLKQMQLQHSQQLVTLTIASGASTSTAVDLTDRVAYGLTVEIVGAAWTDAAIGVAVSEDGSTWAGVYDEAGARIQISGVSTSVRRVYIWDRDLWVIKNYRYARLESINATTGEAVNQGGPRTLRVGVLS